MRTNKKYVGVQSLPEFSVFPNCMTLTPYEGPWRFDLFVKDIRRGTFKHLVDQIRVIADTEKRNEKKRLLPAITPTGVFLPIRNNTNQVSHSGLMVVDFDDVPNIKEIIALLKQDEYCYCFFLSPSGTGIKVFVRIPADSSRHTKLFNALRKYFKKKYGLEADEKCGDIARLCYVSYDPNAYWNPESLVFNDDPVNY